MSGRRAVRDAQRGLKATRPHRQEASAVALAVLDLDIANLAEQMHRDVEGQRFVAPSASRVFQHQRRGRPRCAAADFERPRERVQHERVRSGHGRRQATQERPQQQAAHPATCAQRDARDARPLVRLGEQRPARSAHASASTDGDVSESREACDAKSGVARICGSTRSELLRGPHADTLCLSSL